ncbi:MAG: glycine cleavage system aminomethyltransferase GcvT [Planctomycetota bacterium]|jgi:aminomethyltransferase
MKQTVLHSAHESLGARMVDFAGWSMPVQYRSIIDEAKLVRERAGLFDLGHMGRVRICGPDAVAFLQKLQTNDAAKIAPGRIRYAMILNEQGFTQDDILVYREPANDGFFLVINAGNCERDLAIMHETAKAFSQVEVIDQTDELGMIAIQGPLSQQITSELTDIDLDELKYYAWARGRICGHAGAMSRTGYTGEDGFEFYMSQEATLATWEKLLEIGAADGLMACGLGARDILRLEAGMPLYGHEIDESTTPFDAGLDFAVKLTHDFTGRAALEAQRERGETPRKLVGITSSERRVPRQGYSLHAGDQEIGKVCSGGASPTLGLNIATGYLPLEFAEPGTEISFATRSGKVPATVVPLPFYKRER